MSLVSIAYLLRTFVCLCVYGAFIVFEVVAEHICSMRVDDDDDDINIPLTQPPRACMCASYYCNKNRSESAHKTRNQKEREKIN